MNSTIKRESMTNLPKGNSYKYRGTSKWQLKSGYRSFQLEWPRMCEYADEGPEVMYNLNSVAKTS